MTRQRPFPWLGLILLGRLAAATAADTNVPRPNIRQP